MADCSSERIDSNPYAYPYFHSDGSGPLLYRLVLEAEEVASATSSDGGDGQRRHDDDACDQSRRTSADLLRRIRSRCIVRPVEAEWADSCGDNALHRLCQAAKFGGPPPPRRHRAKKDAACKERRRITGQKPNQQQQQQRPKQKQRAIPWNDLAVTIASSLVEAAPTCGSARNSWREMPLHQFAAHCGIGDRGLDDENGGVHSDDDYSDDDTNEGADRETDEDTSQEGHMYDEAPSYGAASLSTLRVDPTKSQASGTGGRAPSQRMLTVLLTSSPASLSARNYLLGLPLHEACALPGGPDRLVRDPVADLSALGQFESIEAREASLQWVRGLHESVVSRLIDAKPETMFAVDKTGRTPLFCAVESDRTGGDLVRLLLERVEHYCLDVAGFDADGTMDVVRNSVLGRRSKRTAAPAARSSSNESIASSEAAEELRRQVGPWPGGCALADEHRSPLRFLWDSWVWTPRTVSAAVSGGGASATTVAPGSTSPIGAEDNEQHDHVAPSRTTISTLVEAALRRSGANPRAVTTCLGPLWDKTVLLIAAAQRGSVRDIPTTDRGERGRAGGRKRREWRLVHAAVALSCPPAVLRLAFRLHPHQLVERDEDGKTPLLLAASIAAQNGTSQSLCEGTGDDEGRDHDCAIRPLSLLNLLVRANGDACRMADGDGRLPLHLAAENGYAWDSSLRNLFVAEPRAVHARDPVTRFFPFMLAAIANNDSPSQISQSSCESIEGFETRKTSTIFELLKADPSVLNL